MSLAAAAQNVKFEGLKRTKPGYLLKFMRWEDHIPADSASIAEGSQRIRNTRFFNEVESRMDTSKGEITSIFKCQEIFTVLPIIEFGASEGNKWFRAGIEDENGLGRGIRTIAFYQYNNRHSYYLKQSFPFIFKQWGLNYLLKKWSIFEPIPVSTGGLQTYNYTNRDVELLAHYAFDINRNNLEFGVGYMDETYEMQFDEIAQWRLAQSFNRYLLKSNHHLNFLNYQAFYVNGWSNKMQVLASVLNGSGQFFGSFLNETTYFKTNKNKGNVALRSRIGISTNANAFLAPFVLDNYYNIRGIGNRVDRGTAMVTFNAEYRQTLWENRLFGIQMVGFSDMGAFRKSGEPLANITNTTNLKLFAGIGTRLIYKKAYECDLRIDYGVGIHGEGRGFVLGLGQYF
jgi:outer membrane protein assembly factor BamA